MKNTKHQTSRVGRRIVAASIMMACCLFTLASAYAGDREDRDGKDSKDSKFLLISFDENFTSGSTIHGTTTLAGAFSDKGSRDEQFTTSQNGNEVTVTGTVQITTLKGTLTTQFTGVIPAGPNPTYIEGTEYIIGGTGIYAGAKGKGTFEATVDFDTGNIVGVVELKVKSQK